MRLRRRPNEDPALSCTFCTRGIRRDPGALVEMYIDTEFSELCDSPQARQVTCPDCGGTGNDPVVPEYELCGYCEGRKALPFHWPTNERPSWAGAQYGPLIVTIVPPASR